MKIFNVEQGTAEWYRLRMGIPTASCFDQIITPKKMTISSARHKYACRLIAERLLRWQADSLDKIGHIADGKTYEPIAAAQLEEIHEFKLARVGFVKTDDERFGASPDRIVMAGARIDTSVELKCPTVPVQMEYLLLGDDDAYRCQRQGQLYVAEADRAIFYSFHPMMPPYMVESGRDEPFLTKLRDCLEQFSDELEEMTLRARSLGMFQQFAEAVTPLDAERGDAMRAAEGEVDAAMGERW